MSSLAGLFGATTDLVVRHRFDDGDDTITWFDLSVDGSDPMPVANWTHLEDGLISHVRSRSTRARCWVERRRRDPRRLAA